MANFEAMGDGRCNHAILLEKKWPAFTSSGIETTPFLEHQSPLPSLGDAARRNHHINWYYSIDINQHLRYR